MRARCKPALVDTLSLRLRPPGQIVGCFPVRRRECAASYASESLGEPELKASRPDGTH